jgi:hypothetical protein
MSKKVPEKTLANEAMPAKSRRTAHGPEPERLKIYGDWKEAVRLAMRKSKPPGGWPK